MKTSTLAPLAAFACLWVGASTAAERRVTESGLAQIRALQQEKEARTPEQRKIESRLLFALYKERADPRLAAVPHLRTVAPEADGRILVDIDLTAPSGIKRVVRQLRAVGAEVVSHSGRFMSVRARLPLGQTEALAGMMEIRRISIARRPLLQKVDTSEGDVAHRAAAARSFFGVDGSGQKVCVLSDGVDSLAAIQASGDLPAVHVLPGQAGSGDEGTAMLEIVHDLAPGAALDFATAFTSAAQFAQNILNLRADGCNILVDDVLYLDESPFQDNTIAAAVNTVTAAGALYFSSAGNEGNVDDGTAGTWEGNFSGNGTIPGVPGTAHDFGDGGQSILVMADSAANTLHWTDPFGASANDYDLYVMDYDLTTVYDQSTNVQNGNDDPFEITSNGATALERLVVVKRTGADRMINVFAPRGQLDPALTTNGATRGHSAAANAFSVAAVDANSAGGAGGAFNGSEAVETFSSDGPRRIFFNSAGALLPGAPPGDFSATGGVVRQKPDLAAADGVSTATPGFKPFYGTSAAAPHAAAIAALVRQAFPAFTPTQVRAALTGSALDIEAAGTDRDSGAGIVMAYQTLADNGAHAAASLGVSSVATTPISGDGDTFPEPGETLGMSVSLRNTGGAAATALTATLSSTTPGVTITQAASSFPDLAPGASASNATPFAFSLSPSLACGTVMQFRLTVAYAGGVSSPALLDFTLDAGQPGSPVTFSYTGPLVPIPDGLGPDFPGPPAVVPLTLSGLPSRLLGLKLRIDGSACTTAQGAATVGVDHSWVDDLVFELASPRGTTETLINRTGQDGNNFCQTLLDDASTGPSIQGLPSSSAPFTGSFQPATPLAGFRSEDPNGTWHLRVTDNFQTDTGNLRAFSLIATPLVCTAQASLSIDDVSVTEGNSGSTNATFHVTLSAPSSQTVTVKYSTANGTATSGSDYTSVPLTTLTFAPGQTTKAVTVAVKGDTLDEPDETFFVNLSAATNAIIVDSQGVGTILDDDPSPQLAISDVAVTEGDTAPVTAAFTVTLTPASARTVTVAYATADGTALAGVDYTEASGTLTFAPGQASKTINISVSGDTAIEPDETFAVSLSAPTNATLSRAVATGTILNNDFPALSISDIRVLEGNNGTTNAAFAVTLSAVSSQPVTVTYATANGSAVAPSDYTAATGTLTFAPGVTSQTINVSVAGDTVIEPDETFTVTLSAPTKAALGRATATGTIANDDSGPPGTSTPVVWTSLVGVSAAGNSLTKTTTAGWGNAGAASLQTLSAGDGYVEFTASETTSYRMLGLSKGDADQSYSDIDFAIYPAIGGTLYVYEQGVSKGVFGSYVTGDVLRVAVEGGVVRYRKNGTLLYSSVAPSYPLLVDTSLFTQGATLNNAMLGGVWATGPVPALSIADASAVEGNSGTTNAAFAVTLSSPSSQPVTVSYATANGSAVAPSDYTAATGTLTFAPGVTSQTINVSVAGDTVIEPDETFTVTLSAPTNAALGRATATGTIANDDSGPPGTSTPVVWTSLVGVNASGNSLTKTATIGWGNAGAVSQQTLPAGDGYVEFTASETTSYRMLGLSKGDTDQSYGDIDFAIYPAIGGTLYVYEQGVSKGGFGSYVTGDVLRVAVEGGMVRYRQNGTLLYSSIAPSYPLLVDTVALYPGRHPRQRHAGRRLGDGPRAGAVDRRRERGGGEQRDDECGFRGDAVGSFEPAGHRELCHGERECCGSQRLHRDHGDPHLRAGGDVADDQRFGGWGHGDRAGRDLHGDAVGADECGAGPCHRHRNDCQRRLGASGDVHARGVDVARGSEREREQPDKDGDHRLGQRGSRLPADPPGGRRLRGVHGQRDHELPDAGPEQRQHGPELPRHRLRHLSRDRRDVVRIRARGLERRLRELRHRGRAARRGGGRAGPLPQERNAPVLQRRAQLSAPGRHRALYPGRYPQQRHAGRGLAVGVLRTCYSQFTGIPNPPDYSGCCWVRQWSVPKPSTRSTAWMPTTGRSLNSSPRMPRATRSFGSLKVGTRTAAFAT